MGHPGGQPASTAVAVANAVSRLHREYYGRGAVSARAVIQHDYVTVVMEDVYTALEHTLIDAGKHDVVQRTRHEFQLAMSERFCGAVAEIMGRPVVAFMSQVHFDPDIASSSSC